MMDKSLVFIASRWYLREIAIAKNMACSWRVGWEVCSLLIGIPLIFLVWDVFKSMVACAVDKQVVGKLHSCFRLMGWGFTALGSSVFSTGICCHMTGNTCLVGLPSVPSGEGISAEFNDAAWAFFFFVMGPMITWFWSPVSLILGRNWSLKLRSVFEKVNTTNDNVHRAK